MSGEIQKVANKILLWDWEKVALAAIVALAVANILIFTRERRKTNG